MISFSRLLKVAGAVCLTTLALLAVTFDFPDKFTAQRSLPVQRPGLVERLRRMQPDTKEDSRRYTFIDEKERRLEIVFADGCRGLREKAHDGRITRLAEKTKDGMLLVYVVDEAQKLKSTEKYRADGTLFSAEVVAPPQGYRRVFFANDGKTPLARLDSDGTAFTFTIYGARGEKLYEDGEEEIVEDEENGGGEYAKKENRQTYLVFNGADTPRFRQVWSQVQEYGRTGEAQLKFVEEFEPGTLTVIRRITPRVSVPTSATGFETNGFDAPYDWFGGSRRELTRVEVVSNGKVLYERYLDDKLRIVRTVDKTQTPEVVTDIEVGEAGTEELDPVLLKSPESPADGKLAEQLVAGNPENHLERLLAP